MLQLAHRLGHQSEIPKHNMQSCREKTEDWIRMQRNRDKSWCPRMKNDPSGDTWSTQAKACVSSTSILTKQNSPLQTKLNRLSQN